MSNVVGVGQISLMDLNDAIIAGIPPSNPTVGTLWIDESQDPPMLKKWNGEAWIDLGELDPNLSVVIEEINVTLGNMANDNLINFQERQVIKDKLTEIIGYVIPDTATTLPTVATLDSSGKGSFWSVRKSARNVGISTSHSTYVNVATRYNNLKSYLEGLTPINAWDTRNANADIVIPVTKSTFRDRWLQYYLAVDALAELTAQKIKENNDELKDDVDAIGRDLNSLTGRVTTVESKVTDTAIVNTVTRSEAWVEQINVINNKVSKTEFENLQIGGRNLILNSSRDFKVIQIRSWMGTIQARKPLEELGLRPNDPVTLSFYARVPSDAPASVYPRITCYRPDGTYYARAGGKKIGPGEEGFTTFTTILPSDCVSVQFHIVRTDAGNDAPTFEIEIKEEKAEKGNKPTDWTPAPEDVQTKIDGIDKKVDNIKVGGRNLVIRRNELTNKWIDTTGNISDVQRHAVMKDYISVTPNEVLTFTKTDSELVSNGFWRWRWFDAEKKYIARTADNRNEFQWIVPKNTYFIQVSYPIDAFPKIERGNKATDWTPAPEDIEDSIDILATRVNNVEQEITADKIVTTITESTTFQNILDSKADADSLGNFATKDELGELSEDVDDKINDAIKGIDFSPYVTKLELEETSRNITAKFSATGGMNLIRNSIGFADVDFWNTIHPFEIGGRNLVLGSDVFITSGNKAFSFVNDLKDLRGKTVTLSVYVELKNVGFTGTGNRRIGFEPSLVFEDGTVLHLGVWYHPKEGESFKGRIARTITIPDKKINQMVQKSIYIQNLSGDIKVGRPKIEIGNRATDWTPAPEDNLNVSPLTIRNTELDTLGFGSGFYFTGDGRIKGLIQEVPVAVGQPYTLSWYVNKYSSSLYDGEVRIEIIEDDTVTVMKQFSSDEVTTGYEHGNGVYIPDSDTIHVRIVGNPRAEAVITGLMLNIGDVPLQWSLATGEVYNTNIRMDINGIRVSQLDKDRREIGYTQITPDEFAGYYDSDGNGTFEKVFYLNGEETVTKKFRALNEITMGGIKIININSGGRNGWAFVPIVEE